jgi:exodeoxyribonuclease-3
MAAVAEWERDAIRTRTKEALIDREERKGKGASDHAPVVVDLAP